MMDEAKRMSANVIAGQLQIDVPDSPGAIGKWDVNHQFSAYRDQMGEERAAHQRKLAEEAGVCSCGVDEREAAKAAEEGRRKKRVLGHLHHPGCPAFRALSKKRAGITEEEQVKRLDELKDELRSALDRAREEDRL